MKYKSNYKKKEEKKIPRRHLQEMSKPQKGGREGAHLHKNWQGLHLSKTQFISEVLLFVEVKVVHEVKCGI
jgi:hypothetical protein